MTVYLPLAVFMFVLLFPFYWMAITTFKPNDELYDYADYSPFWVDSPTLAQRQEAVVRDRLPGVAVEHDDRSLSPRRCSRSSASVLAAYAIERLRFQGANYGRAADLSRLSGAAVDPVHSRWRSWCSSWGSSTRDWALILTYPTFLIPFCTWLLMGYFRTDPYELEECALIDGATRMQILWKIMLPLAVPGLISAGIFAFTLSWNEFIYALTFISSSEHKTVPVGVLTELVEGDVYHWGSLMAGALFGSLPVAIIYSFFVEYYVSGLTGAVKE